jgi:ABC-type multidrug transport system fused ATPase/permease subunit
MSSAKFYSDAIPQEAPAEVPAEDSAVVEKFRAEGKTWPVKGEIKFETVSMRYRNDLPLVLNGITAKIRGGERVGVVGRTGAGEHTPLTLIWATSVAFLSHIFRVCSMCVVRVQARAV